MSIQSDAAKKWIEELLMKAYPKEEDLTLGQSPSLWFDEYQFDKSRKWRFDYAVPSILCANPEGSFFLLPEPPTFWGEIEIDGATFVPKTGHNTGTGLRSWREKNNAAMTAGWRVFHYAPEEIIKAGRKTLSDEPILKKLPWL